jgi:hypothetical protein
VLKEDNVYQNVKRLYYLFYFQVSTLTGSVSHYDNLGIIVLRAYIFGANKYYAKAGGDISFVCLIEEGIGVVWGDFGWLLEPSIVRGSS